MVQNFVSTAEMSRDEWLEARRSGIGGSDAAVILGFNKWKSPFQLYLDKTGGPLEETDNEFIYWGNVLEDVVAKEFQARTGKRVRRMNKMLRHPEHDFMTANLDRVIVGEKAFLECKTTSAYKVGEWDGEDIPAAYLCQVQHYLAVTGFEKAYIAVLIGGNKYVWKEIKRDQELIDIMIDREKDFWENHVLAEIPPEIDGSDAAVEFISHRYKENPGEVAMLDSEKEKIIEALDNVKAEIKALKELENKYTNQLKMSLETASEGLTEHYKLTYKTINQTRLDSKKIKEELPNIFAKYSNTTSYRKFGYKKVN